MPIRPLLTALLLTIPLESCGSAERDDTGGVTQPAPRTATDTAAVVIDARTAYQRVDGFGGTLLTLVYPTGDYLGEFRQAALAAAFQAVGITRGSLNIGLVETRSTTNDVGVSRGNDNADPQVMDATGFNFLNLDILQDKVLAPGTALGFKSTELGPMLDYRFPQEWLRAVRSTNYELYLDEAAENVVAVLQNWRTRRGAYPALVHLFNEPTSGNVELYTRSTQEVVDLVRRVGTRMRASGITNTRFIVPNEETMARSLEVASAILADPVARQFVGAIGFHQYPYRSVSASPKRMLETSGSGLPDATTRAELNALRDLGARYGVPLWMTEVSEGPGNADFPYGAIEHVLARVVHIHDTFEYGGVSAYFGMNTFWDSKTQSEHIAGQNPPFWFDQSAIVLIDQAQKVVKITGVGYAIGHYARWLDSTAVRLESTSSAPRVLVTAFRDERRQRVVTVIANADTRPQLLRLRLTGATPAGGTTGEASRDTVRWGPIDLVTIRDGVTEYLAPPRSVVTLAIPIR